MAKQALVNKFLEVQKANGTKGSTLGTYEVYLKPMAEFKPLEEWTQENAIEYILLIQQKYKESTVESVKVIIKMFFKWLNKPEVVEDIKVKTLKNNLKREDILTIEDINKLIDTTPSTLYKALMAFLFESGARINEGLAIKVKDLQETNEGMIVSVPQTKTGNDYRRILCPFSAQYIRNHVTYNALESNDRLFNITAVAAWRRIKKIGKESNIGKPVTPHKFRHAQATDMVLRGYQESIIRKKLGWSADSRMISRYQHIIDDDVITATLEKNNNPIEKRLIENIKPAEKLSIADGAMMFSKLATENEELKKELEAIRKDMDTAKKMEPEAKKLAVELLDQIKKDPQLLDVLRELSEAPD